MSGLSNQVHTHKYRWYNIHRLDSPAYRQLGEVRNNKTLAGPSLEMKTGLITDTE